MGYVTIGDMLTLSGANSPESGNVETAQALADPFTRPASGSFFVWSVAPGGPAIAGRGRPYLVFDLDDPDKARIVSMGPNGEYEGGAGDDLVLAIFR